MTLAESPSAEPTAASSAASPNAESSAEPPPAVITVRMDYDSFGNVNSMTDGRGFTTTRTFDSENELVTVTSPAASPR